MNPGVMYRWGKWFLFAATVLIYLRALAGEFVWDDVTYFVENDILPNLKPWNLQSIFLYPTNYWNENLPLTEFLFALEYYTFGTFTPAYHLVSLFLYLCVAALAWKFVSQLYQELPARTGVLGDEKSNHQLSVFLVLALFLLHPVHVEVVAYITGQKDLLSVLFMLLSINIFWAVWKRHKLRNPVLLAAAVACYYLAILAKNQAIATGLFIPLLWLVLRREGEGRPVKVLAVWGLLNVPVVLWLNYSSIAVSNLGQTGVSPVSAVLRGVRILGAHMIIAFKPHPLNFGYPFDPSWSLDLNFLVGLLVLGALAVSLASYRRSIVTIGLLIVVVYFILVMQIFIEIPNAKIFDRYLFFPILGLCLIVERSAAALMSRWQSLRWVLGSAFLALVLFLATLTFNYIPKFANNLVSTKHAYYTFPGWKRAAFDYQGELIDAGYLDEAARLNETEETFSDPPWVRDYFAGRIEIEKGNFNQAIFYLKRSSVLIRRGGYFPFTGVPLGMALIQIGKIDEAELYLKDVLKTPLINPIETYRAKNLLAEISGQGASLAGEEN